MTNPYQKPAAALPQTPATPGRILLVVGLVAALVAASIITATASSFAQMYESLNADLPRATRLIVTSYLCVWALPMMVLLAWFRWPTPRHRPLWACLLGMLGLLLLVPFVIAALYWPLLSSQTPS